MDAAIEAALGSAKAINSKAVVPFLKDMDKVELLEDGTIKGLSEQLEGLAKADDTKFLFSTETKGKIKDAKPGEGGKEDPDTKVDTSKMTYSELAAYMVENPDVKID